MSHWFLVLALMYLGACKSTGEKPFDSEIAGTNYVVRRGDTLEQIAIRFRISIHEIMETNGIDNPRSLQIGQALFLPDGDPIGSRIAKHKKPSVTKIARAPTKNAQVTRAHVETKLFSFPVPGGQITREFSKNKISPYDGIGIKAKIGAKVLAAASGKIIFVGDDGTKFGLIVIVEHNESFVTVYTNLGQATVATGQNVKTGSVIGAIGKSGGLDSPRLHFQVRVDQKPKNPREYLKST